MIDAGAGAGPGCDGHLGAENLQKQSTEKTQDGKEPAEDEHAQPRAPLELPEYLRQNIIEGSVHRSNPSPLTKLQTSSFS